MVGWINSGEAADLVNQSYPVPIGDFDIVVMVTGSRITMNSKLGELQPQYLPTLHLDFFCLVKVVRVIAREVWRGDNTCAKRSLSSLKCHLRHSPSLPQSSGQSGECLGCQSPDPVVESGAQVIVSVSQRPQQHLETNGDCSVPPLPPSSYLQSRAPAGATQGWPGVGGRGGQSGGNCQFDITWKSTSL